LKGLSINGRGSNVLFWQHVIFGFAEKKKMKLEGEEKQSNEAICKINDVDHMLEGSECVCIITS